MTAGTGRKAAGMMSAGLERKAADRLSDGSEKSCGQAACRSGKELRIGCLAEPAEQLQTEQFE